ncbi:MAG: Hint domain-containing protein [Gemmobacter sp.]|nr:Hint domain-containing protein [Gemmobacter sp.]
MTEISFYARGDSSSANNAAVNVQGTSTTPTTLLTFSSGATGDIRLDYNNGLPDPDTVLIINSVSMSFTVEFSGLLPDSNKLSNVNGQDLRGAEIAVITAANGQRYFFLTDGGSLATMTAFPNGAHGIVSVTNGGNPVLLCFIAGTLIATPQGERAVEGLQPGDLVSTADGGAVPLRWLGHRRVSGFELARYPELRPVVIPAGLFGPGQPHSDLGLSPQHRIVVDGWQVELLFGAEAMLMPALHLVGAGARHGTQPGPLDFYHLLFDGHAVVLANGLRSESFQPGSRALRPGSAARREVDLLFPGLLCKDTPRRDDCLPTLRSYESRALCQMWSGRLQQAA